MQPVFVGDVQGCDEELGELLARIADLLGPDGFELWLVGDLVNRGPASLRVLQRVRPLVERGRARVVLGNHEVNLLCCSLGLRSPSPHDTFGDVLSAPDADSWLDWIRTWRLAEVARLGGRSFAMVHAAVSPAWTLDRLAARAKRIEARLAESREAARAFLAADRSHPDRDDLGLLTRSRSIDARGRWRDAEPDDPADAWHARWSAARHDYGVVYGHWSLQGLHVAPLLRGLDTGCVHHGRDHDGFLTAWIPDVNARDPFAVPEQGRFVRVRARRAYYRELLESLGEKDSA